MAIFEITEDNTYKGVLFAILDCTEVEKEMNEFFPNLQKKSSYPGLMAVIWVDKDGIWNMKLRIKFMSGNKQAASVTYGKDSNCTAILSDLYKKLPLINKEWFKCEKGTVNEILEIIQKADMLESYKRYTKEEYEHVFGK